MLRKLILFFFKKAGWRIQGEIPKEIRKAVFVGGPHTSNWDLFYTLGLMFSLNIKYRFLIKKEALVFPIKGLLKSLGAYPVERSKEGHNYVDQISKVFEEGDECFLCIAPEGTRKPTKKWKTGFYHIAKKAQVPIVVGYLNCDTKTIHVGDILYAASSEDEVMDLLKNIMKQAVPKNPKNFQL